MRLPAMLIISLFCAILLSMKELAKRMGIISLVAVTGFVMAACVVYEQKHETIEDLYWLTGTWKTSMEEHYVSQFWGPTTEITEITATFGNVINNTIELTLTTKITIIRQGEYGDVEGTITGSKFLDAIFGLSKKGYRAKTTDSTDSWTKTYTLAEVQKLHWSLRTFKSEATLEIDFLIPGEVCDCDLEECDYNCHNACILSDGYHYVCSDPYCGAKPQGRLEDGFGNSSRVLKKQ